MHLLHACIWNLIHENQIIGYRSQSDIPKTVAYQGCRYDLSTEEWSDNYLHKMNEKYTLSLACLQLTDINYCDNLMKPLK